jgi:hypothetical protein
MSLSSIRMSAALQGVQSETRDLGTASFPFALSASYSWTDGTGPGQASKVFADTRTLSASANEDLDFAGVLLDGLGNVLTFATIKAILITAAAANVNNVVVSRPASNGVPLFDAASDAISIKPGGMFMWVAPGTGVTVTAATGDLINFLNSGAGTGVTYSIEVLGT